MIRSTGVHTYQWTHTVYTPRNACIYLLVWFCGMYLNTVHFLLEASLVISRVILLASMSPSTQEQREQVKKSYQRMLSILDALEEKLLPGRAEKKRSQKQSKERATNVTDSLNDSPLQV